MKSSLHCVPLRSQRTYVPIRFLVPFVNAKCRTFIYHYIHLIIYKRRAFLADGSRKPE